MRKKQEKEFFTRDQYHMTYAEIAKELGVSRQYIEQVVKKALKKAKTIGITEGIIVEGEAITRD